MTEEKKAVINPSIVLREESDEWALLFNPDTGETYGLDPVSVSIWKCLDGKHTMAEIVSELQKQYDDMPVDAEKQISDFIEQIIKRGFAKYEG